MRIRSITAAAALVLSAAGCTTVGPMGGADMTPEDRAGYVAMAAASDQFEIQSSQLALSRAQGGEVRRFAQMMVDHHSRTTAALNAAAAASGTNAPAPMLLPMQQRMISELQDAPAGRFDQTYMRQQVAAHEMALALHRNYAAQGDAAPLRTAAAAAVPIVAQHLQEARRMN